MREGTITAEEYQKLKDVDIREIDPATAADIRGITVNPDLPPAERLLDVARQMNGNPFVYRCGDLLVKTSFAGTASLQSVLEECLEKLGGDRHAGRSSCARLHGQPDFS